MKSIPVILLCLLIILPAFAQETAPKPPEGESQKKPPKQMGKDEQLKKDLETKEISMKLSDIPLKRMLSTVQDLTGLRIILDEKSDTGQLVTLHVKDLTIKNLLVLISDQAGVTYGVKDGVIYFATKERLLEVLAQRGKAYDLKFGLKKGQEFTCVVNSAINAKGTGKDDNSSFKFDIVCKVEDVTKEGIAKIKGQAKGEATMQWLPEMGKSETREIDTTEFEAEITKNWGFKSVEGQKFLCPGFEPLKDILPGKPVKKGDEWEANLTRTVPVFMLLALNTPQATPGGPDQGELQKMLVKNTAQLISRLQVPVTMTLAEVKDGVAVIKGTVKEKTVLQIAPKDSTILIHFDTKTGFMTLFSSKLRLSRPNEGVADMIFRQEMKLKVPRKKSKYTDEELKDICMKSDVVAAVEIVVLEKREKFSYYVVKLLSELKGSSGKEHLDVLAAKSMELDKGDKCILFLTKTEESGRKIYKLIDSKKGVVEHDEKLLKRIAAATKDK